MIRDLVIKNRSYRRFDSNVTIAEEQLVKWIELARFSATGRNKQSLKFVLCNNAEMNANIFPNLGWAGYLTNWKGPEVNERPTAYIVILNDKSISENYHCDEGIAAQSILLGAVEDGFGGCMIGTVHKSKVAKLLSLPENLEILLVIALGKPTEEVVLDDAVGDDIKYWRDEKEIHHVPKRPLDELIYKSF
jgi:nitroreductase